MLMRSRYIYEGIIHLCMCIVHGKPLFIASRHFTSARELRKSILDQFRLTGQSLPLLAVLVGGGGVKRPPPQPITPNTATQGDGRGGAKKKS